MVINNSSKIYHKIDFLYSNLLPDLYYIECLKFNLFSPHLRGSEEKKEFYKIKYLVCVEFGN